MDKDIGYFSQCVAPLLEWFRAEKRDLPWRHTDDPYRIWVSEIMLQQTRVEAVKGYYARFLEAFPTVFDLANAEEDKMYKAWEGLGYYNRVKNMKAAAKTVVAEYGGKFPANRDLLRSLKGIGDYTAGSISSIAFRLPEPAVDGNVLRVLTRVLQCDKNVDRDDTKRYFADILRAVFPAGAERDFTESLMELGALVCVPNGDPLCERCPLHGFCKAKGNPAPYPVKDKKRDRKIEEKTMLVLETEKGFYLQKREKGVLKGLWQFPLFDGFLTDAEIKRETDELKFQGKIKKLTVGKHIFTHIEWKIAVYYGKGTGEGKIPWEQLKDYPVPSAISQFFPKIASVRK